MDDIDTLGGGIHTNCTPPAIDDFPRDFFTEEQRQGGAVAVHVIVSLYLFMALAVVCDKFFVPAVERICHALNMSNDVAGATFMAAATSAPELFVNVIGTFITEGDIGVGTIVGSAVFNILAVAACCGIGAGMYGVQVVPLDWWPLTRDCLAYGITVSILICIIHDERVEWYEALCLVLLYIVYIAVMYYDKSIQRCARGGVRHARKHSRRSRESSKRPSIEAAEAQQPLQPHKICTDGTIQQHNCTIGSNTWTTKEKQDAVTIGVPDLNTNIHIIPPAHLNGSVKLTVTDPNTEHATTDMESKSDNSKGTATAPTSTTTTNVPPGGGGGGIIEESRHSLWKWPAGRGSFTQLTWILTWPIHLIFFFTIPDCEKPRFKRWFPLTFLMCIIWIGSLSYVVAWMITIIGDTLKIPDSVMGITFLAAGTSVPEAVSSVIVAKQGHGSMGISNSIGSNTFDILLCLGLPWFIKAAFMPTVEGKHWVGINSSGLEYSAISLLSTLMMLYAAFSCNKFKLDKRVGRACLIMYAMFLILASLIELNVFFRVNLPTCGR